MEVVISTPEGQSLRTSVEPSAPISSVRRALGLSADLRLAYEGQVLQEDRDFASYGLQPGGEITALAHEQEQITVITLKGKTVFITVSQSDTIGSFKTQIQHLTNYEQDMQRLVTGGEVMRNFGCVSDYNLVTGITVELVLPDDVLVCVAGKMYCLAKEMNTVRHLKEKLQSSEDAPVEQQVLKLDHRELADTECLTSLRTSKDHCIHLQLSGNISLIVRRSKKTASLPCRQEEFVQLLGSRKPVDLRAQESYGVTNAKRVFIFTGRTLQELKLAARSERIYAGDKLLTGDKTLLRDFGLRNMQEVSALSPEENLLWVKLGSSHVFSLIAEQGICVGEVKDLIQRDWNFSSCYLLSASRELSNAHTVDDFTQPLELLGHRGFTHAPLPRAQSKGRPMRGLRGPISSIGEAWKPLLLVIARTSGQLFHLGMRDDCSLLALKAAISEITGFEIAEQRLYSKAKILNDRKNLKFNNIRHLDLVYVLTPSDIVVRARVGEVIHEIPMRSCATVENLKQALLGPEFSHWCVVQNNTIREDEMQLGQLCRADQLHVQIVTQAAAPQPVVGGLTVKGAMGKLRVRAEDMTAGDLKAALSKHVTHPFDLYLDGKILEAEESLAPFTGKTLALVSSKQMSVSVRQPHGQLLTFHLSPLASVSCLKAAIKKQEGYSFSSMSILLQQKPLPNQQQLVALEAHSELELKLANTFQVTVGTHLLEVHAKYLVSTVKAMCGQADLGLAFLGAEMEDMQRLEDYNVGAGAQLELQPFDQFVAVKMTWRSVPFIVRVLSTVKVETLHTIIARKTGLKSEEQKLYFGSRLLKPGEILADYNAFPMVPSIDVCNSSEICLSYIGQSLVVKAEDTVEKVRIAIQRLEALSELPLLMQGQRVLVDKDIVTNLNPKMDLEIVSKDLILVRVEWNERFCLAIEPTTTISSLRAILARVTARKEEELLLVLNGQLLTETTELARDLLHNKELRLLLKYFTLTLKHKDTSTELTVPLDSSVEQLKSILQTQTGVPASKQQILFRNSTLSRPLYHYDLTHTPILTLLVCSSLALLVQQPSELIEVVEVDPQDTIQTIATEGTQAWCKGYQLTPSMTFVQAGIRTGDLLTLNHSKYINCQVQFAGKLITVTIPEGTRMAVLKEKLAKELSIAVGDQLLVMDTYVMPDTHVVRACMQRDPIELITPEQQPCLVTGWTGAVKVITFGKYKGKKKVLNIKKALAKKWNIAVEKQILLQGDQPLEDDTMLSWLPHRNLFFLEQGQTIVVVQGRRLFVTLDTTVENTLYGALQGEQTAVDYHLSYRGGVLPEEWTIKQANVGFCAALDLIATEEITVRVQSESERRVTVRKDDPVSVLKTELGRDGVLLWQWEELDEKLTLSSQGVYSQATLHFYPADAFLPLRLDAYEGALDAECLPDSPISALKKRIQRKHGIDVSKQRIIFPNGNEASDDDLVSPLFAAVGTFLTPNDELLRIQASDSIHNLIVKYSHTIEELKTRLQDLCPHQKIDILLEGSRASNEALLSVVGIVTGVVISLDGSNSDQSSRQASG